MLVAKRAARVAMPMAFVRSAPIATRHSLIGGIAGGAGGDGGGHGGSGGSGGGIGGGGSVGIGGSGGGEGGAGSAAAAAAATAAPAAAGAGLTRPRGSWTQARTAADASASGWWRRQTA